MMRNGYTALVSKPDDKQSLGGLHKLLEDNIKMNLEKEYNV
jgi:hypothetical protein